MSRRILAISFAVISTLSAGCRTTGAIDDVRSFRDVPPGPVPKLVRSPACPAAASMLQAFHQGALKGPLQMVQGRVDEVLASCPLAWEAHEVAALVARLEGHDDDAVVHWMQAAADLRATDARFFIAELYDEGIPVSLERAKLAFFEELSAQHPDPGVRADAASRRIELAVLFDESDVAWRGGLGVVEAWRVIGAFDNDQGKGFLTEYPPEEHVDLDEELPGRLVPIRFRPVERLKRAGIVPLDDIVSPPHDSVAYLVTWLQSDVKRRAHLELSTDAAFRVFLNGKLAGEEQKVDSFAFDAFSMTIDLDAGDNELLVKSANEGGAWNVRARIVDDAGLAIAGVTASDAPPAKSGKAKAASASAAPAGPMVVVGHAQGPAGPRRSYIEARELSRSGLVRDALEAARKYAEQSKDTPLAVLLVSQLEKRNQEAGKAIDLLNKTIADDVNAPSALLLERAQFYVSKKRYDAGQDDLNAILKRDGDDRAARIELAKVFDARGWTLDRCRALDVGLKRWPDSTALLQAKADCLRDLGLRKDARQMQLGALGLEPGNLALLRGLAEQFGAVEDLDDAKVMLVRSAAVDDTAAGPLLALAHHARVTHDLKAAHAYLEQAKHINPDDDDAWKKLGDMAYDGGDKKTALALWREALARDPSDSDLAVHIDFVADEGLGDLAKYAPSREDIQKDIAAAAAKEAAPGSNVVAILDNEVTEVNADGSGRALVTEVLLAVNQRGRDQLISFKIPRGQVRILDAHSITPSGETQEASSIAGGVIRFRHLDVGSVTVVQYLAHRSAGGFLPNHFVQTWFFSGVQRDVRDATWTVIMPKDRELVRHVEGDVTETVKDTGNKRVRTWRAVDVPPLLPENNMPPAANYLRRVSVSTLATWDEYVRWEQALLKDAFRSNPEVDALAQKLLEGATTPRDKIDRLYRYVAKDIRYTQEYESTIAGVKPHACPVVLERGYGDCKDKAVLLILLMKKAGLDADFAILRTTGMGRVEKDVPNQQFNHAIVYVPKQAGIDEGFFTDPTTDALDAGNLRSDDQGATSLVIDPDKGTWHFETIPYQSADVDYSRATIALDVAKARAHLDVSARGTGASSVRKAVRDVETEKKVLQAWGTGFWPGASLVEGKADTSEDLTKPFTAAIDVDVGASLHDDSDGQRVDLPHFYPFAGFTSLAERKLPLRMGIASSGSLDLSLAIPAGKKVLRTPADFHVSHACFTADRTTTTTASTITMKLAYTETCPEISGADYAAFRAKALDVVSKEHDPLVLSK